MTDPTHPLFGRRFALISVSSPLQGAGSALVSYREYMVLRLPVASTTLAVFSARHLHQTYARCCQGADDHRRGL